MNIKRIGSVIAAVLFAIAIIIGFVISAPWRMAFSIVFLAIAIFFFIKSARIKKWVTSTWMIFSIVWIICMIISASTMPKEVTPPPAEETKIELSVLQIAEMGTSWKVPTDKMTFKVTYCPEGAIEDISEIEWNSINCGLEIESIVGDVFELSLKDIGESNIELWAKYDGIESNHLAYNLELEEEPEEEPAAEPIDYLEPPVRTRTIVRTVTKEQPAVAKPATPTKEPVVEKQPEPEPPKEEPIITPVVPTPAPIVTPTPVPNYPYYPSYPNYPNNPNYGGGSNTSFSINGRKNVTVGETVTYTVTGVSNFNVNKVEGLDGLDITKVSSNKFKVTFDYVGSYNIGYQGYKKYITVTVER